MNPRGHWRANRRLTALLLALWFTVSFVLPFFARELSGAFFGWPFSYWLAAQGALVVYVLIVWIYSLRMRRIDQAHGVAEPLDGGR
jgi:putative solute:sodium symporter small subunit